MVDARPPPSHVSCHARAVKSQQQLEEETVLKIELHQPQNQRLLLVEEFFFSVMMFNRPRWTSSPYPSVAHPPPPCTQCPRDLRRHLLVTNSLPSLRLDRHFSRFVEYLHNGKVQMSCRPRGGIHERAQMRPLVHSMYYALQLSVGSDTTFRH